MKLRLAYGLPFISVCLTQNNRTLTLENVLLDTGSAGTIIPADIAINLGLGPDVEDEISRIRGVGGTEFVYSKRIQKIKVGTLVATDFIVEVGAMDYGFNINGILGMDFLLNVKAVLDLRTMEIRGSRE